MKNVTGKLLGSNGFNLMKQKTNEFKDDEMVKRKDTLERKVTSERKKKEIVKSPTKKPSNAEIKEIVDSIWVEYNPNPNDELDKKTIKKFFADNISSLKLKSLSNKEFEKFYAEIDQDKNGSISKSEMVNLVSKIMKQKEQKND